MKSLVKSLGANWAKTLIAGVALMSAAGCSNRRSDPELATVYETIDAGNVLDTDLGEGAGVFVEYARGGVWRVWTSCDTAVTSRACEFEVDVTSESVITDAVEFDTEGGDSVRVTKGGDLRFVSYTSYGSDEVSFVTDPGALTTIRVFLDGLEAPEFMVWFGNGRVREGADGSPVVFQPDVP